MWIASLGNKLAGEHVMHNAILEAMIVIAAMQSALLIGLLVRWLSAPSRQVNLKLASREVGQQSTSNERGL